MEMPDPTEPVDNFVAKPETEIIESPKVVEGGLPPHNLFEMENELRKARITNELGRLAGLF